MGSSRENNDYDEPRVLRSSAATSSYLILIDEPVDDLLHHDFLLDEFLLGFDLLLDLAQIPADQIALPGSRSRFGIVHFARLFAFFLSSMGSQRRVGKGGWERRKGRLGKEEGQGVGEGK